VVPPCHLTIRSSGPLRVSFRYYHTARGRSGRLTQALGANDMLPHNPAALLLLMFTSLALAESSGYPISAPAGRDIDAHLLSKVTFGSTFEEIVQVLGAPHADTCSGVYCYVWFVSDGRTLTVSPANPGEAPLRIEVRRCSHTPCKRDDPFAQ
jgi:hypothetical protein